MTIRRFLIAAVALLGATGFVVKPRVQTSRAIQFRLASTTTAPPPPKKKEEKLTMEAQELLDAFQAKGSDEPDAPRMIVAQVAPSVRVAISEEFGLEPGAFAPGQLVAALKAMGFDAVFDTNTAADMTICEEGTELLHRIRQRLENPVCEKSELGEAPACSQPLPLFTSCCPGWMAYVEKSAPELAPYVSSCKSPHMMFGAVLKEYAEKMVGLPPDKVYFASVMPCVRKRGESDGEAFVHNGVRDVDNVVTTKDIGMLFRQKGINPGELEAESFDSPFLNAGGGSGAGQLFGATGGVMEAAVRTVYEVVTGCKLPKLELEEVRGLDGVKEAVIPMCQKTDGCFPKECLDLNLRVACCSGLGNLKKLIAKMKAGEVEYDFVEVMACPGGCIGGGGQPKGDKDAIEKRLHCIYDLDRKLPIRRSHENPTVKTLYGEDYLGGYGSEKAHELLHVEPVYGKLPAPKDSSPKDSSKEKKD